MEPRERLGWCVLVHFLACFHRVPDGSELQFRLFVDSILRNWSGRVPGPDLTFQLSWRGSLEARRTPSSTCEASGLDHKPLLQLQLLFICCSELEGLRGSQGLVCVWR